jgi:4-amino-4-deoxy-L-arabinose transferase-like glycosyltransferase
MAGRRAWRRWGGWALALALAFWVLSAPGEHGTLTDDEREYAQAAIHLLRDGVFSHAPPGESVAPDAYREPGYALFVAGVWRLCGADTPATPAALEKNGAAALRAVRCLRRAQRLALLIAAWGAALAARRLGGGRGAAVAAALLVFASPALRHLSGQLASEALAAPLLTLAAVALAALAERSTAGRAIGAGLLLGSLAVTRAAFAYLLPFAALVPLLRSRPPRREPWRRRFLLAAGLLAVSLLPTVLWMVRNARQFGSWTLAERGGVVQLARAELSLDLAREGRWGAVLAWTPGGLARDLHRRWFPASRLHRWEWSGPPERANYFVRAIHRRTALLASLGDRLAADAALRREAVAIVRKDPGAYLLSLPPLLWRGLFAERSPAWALPFDLALPLGLLLAIGFVVVLGRAVAQRSGPQLALLLLPTLSFLFHTLVTEQLPRFHQPALPLAWAAVAALLFPREAPPGA